MAGNYNIAGDAGADYVVTFTWQDSTGDPIDVTGYTAVMTFAAQFGALRTLLELTSDPPAGITLGGALGTIECAISHDQTMALPAQGAWMLVLTAGDGEVTRLVQGAFSMTQGAPV